MPATATPTQRDAQKRIVGILNANMVLNRGGLALWREDHGHDLYLSATADDVVADLAELGVNTTVLARIMPPRAKENRVRQGREVRVAWSELATLIHWTPALKKKMDGLREDCPTVHEFVCYQPGPKGMSICTLNYAALWPWWTVKQATRMGLMCATCGWDLRTRTEDADRLAYRIPDADGRHRFYCGGCCDHGLDHLGTESA